MHPGFKVANSLTDEGLRRLIGTSWGRSAVQTEAEFIAALGTIKPGTKLIVIGAKESQINELQANPDLFVIDTPITKSGRAMQLMFVREQSISITQHRFGAIQEELVNILNESNL